MNIETVWKNHTTGETLTFSGIFNNPPFTEKSSFPQYESSPEWHDLELLEVRTFDKGRTN